MDMQVNMDVDIDPQARRPIIRRRRNFQVQLNVGVDSEGTVDNNAEGVRPEGEDTEHQMHGEVLPKHLNNMDDNANVPAKEPRKGPANSANNPAGPHGHAQEPSSAPSPSRIKLRVRVPSPFRSPFRSPSPNASLFPPSRFPPPEVYAAEAAINNQKIQSLRSQISCIQSQIDFLQAAQSTATAVDHTILTPQRHACSSTELFEEQRDEYIEKLWKIAEGDEPMVARTVQLREINRIEKEVLHRFGGGKGNTQVQALKMKGTWPKVGSIEARLHGCNLR